MYGQMVELIMNKIESGEKSCLAQQSKRNFLAEDLGFDSIQHEAILCVIISRTINVNAIIIYSNCES